MTKNEFVQALDALVADPENILSNAMNLRVAVSQDYDNFESTNNAYEQLKSTYESTQKQLTDMKELNLKLFMSQPSVPKPNEPVNLPVDEPPAETPTPQPTIDDLISNIREQLK